MDRLKLGLVGIGGFGERHLDSIRTLENEGRVQLKAICDTALGRYRCNLEKRSYENIEGYDNIDRLLASEKGLDLIVIATPIPLHKEMCCKAMEAGFDVFLEKPPAVVIQDIDKMLDVMRRTGRKCLVDFQETSGKGFAEFKNVLLQGRIGRITRVSAAGLWKRAKAYYTRAPWVGRILFEGSYVLDGTINNPFSHLLNNCLVLVGLQKGTDNHIERVKAELYSCNDIEGEDTSCMRIDTRGGVEVLFFATLCHSENLEPYIVVEGTQGEAIFKYNGSSEFRDPEGKLLYESGTINDSWMEHYRNLVDYLQGYADKPSCTLEDTRNFVLASNLAFESAGSINRLDGRFVEFRKCEKPPNASVYLDGDYVFLKGIKQYIESGMKKGKLFSEMGIEWAVDSTPFSSEGYREFNMYRPK